MSSVHLSSTPPPPPTSSHLPPHPGSAWQKCADSNSGYPYYWNTSTNQVRWDCPSEYIQYQQLMAKQLYKQPPLPPNPPPPEPEQPNDQTSSRPNLPGGVSRESSPSVVSGLVSAYDDSDDETVEDTVIDESPVEENKSSDELELLPNFIGPVIPKPEEDPAPTESLEDNDAVLLLKLEEKSETLVNMGSPICNNIDPDNIAKIEEDLAEDILSQIEAEKPPDYNRGSPLPATSVPQTSSMLQLACDYGGDSDDSETDSPVKPTVNGQVGRNGKMTFSNSDSWQTEEQKIAIESYKSQEAAIQTIQSNGKLDYHNDAKIIESSRVTTGLGRKRRLALPGGKYNKTDVESEEKRNKVDTPDEKHDKPPMVPFVKSTSSLFWNIEKQSSDVGVEVEEEKKEIEKEKPNLSLVVGELVAKLEYFRVVDEHVSSLKSLAIKLETLYTAWRAGALASNYLSVILQGAENKISAAENKLKTGPWSAVWDRLEYTYKFTNDETGEIKQQDIEETEAPPSPPLPPAIEEVSEIPPLPEDPAPPSADHQLQDMEIDEESACENTVNITDELSNFYTELGVDDPSPPPSPTPPPTKKEMPAPASPAKPEVKKKKKKVKVSNNISLKKKGVGDMLAKWQNIKD